MKSLFWLNLDEAGVNVLINCILNNGIMLVLTISKEKYDF